jgi:uncharacterized coiled-coil protein SlyX
MTPPGDREGLIRRISQIRQLAATPDRSPQRAGEPLPERMTSLEARVTHLEGLLEGLQDSVHRESERHAALIAELQEQIKPGSISASLAQDARNRGL